MNKINSRLIRLVHINTHKATTLKEAAASVAPPREAGGASPYKARKAVMTLSPSAVAQLKALTMQGKLVRIGIKSKGCSGAAYSLEYVEKKAKFDEEVTQDGVSVLIDSKALLRMIGSQMDWVNEELSSKFIFHNPNVKDQCGCGESVLF